MLLIWQIFEWAANLGAYLMMSKEDIFGVWFLRFLFRFWSYLRNKNYHRNRIESPPRKIRRWKRPKIRFPSSKSSWMIHAIKFSFILSLKECRFELWRSTGPQLTFTFCCSATIPDICIENLFKVGQAESWKISFTHPGTKKQNFSRSWFNAARKNPLYP